MSTRCSLRTAKRCSATTSRVRGGNSCSFPRKRRIPADRKKCVSKQSASGRLTRQRWDLTDYAMQTNKILENQRRRRVGMAVGEGLQRRRNSSVRSKCKNADDQVSKLVGNETPLTTERIVAIRADLKECFVEHSGLRLGKSERIFYAPLFQSKTFIDHLVQRALRVNQGTHAESRLFQRTRQAQTGQIGA